MIAGFSGIRAQLSRKPLGTITGGGAGDWPGCRPLARASATPVMGPLLCRQVTLHPWKLRVCFEISCSHSLWGLRGTACCLAFADPAKRGLGGAVLPAPIPDVTFSLQDGAEGSLLPCISLPLLSTPAPGTPLMFGPECTVCFFFLNKENSISASWVT